ncbi:MAG: amidohydrolase [Bacteroidia bacterium]
MSTLKLAVLQTDLVWEDKSANLKQIGDQLVALEEQVDLVLLPEMFATGFTMNVKHTWSSMDGVEVQWMQQQAKRLNTTLGGSLHIFEDGKHYNRFLLVNADGIVAAYDKRHLFALAGEDEHYTAGLAHSDVQLGDWKIRLQICYDLRFPVWARNTSEYDLLVYVANWPERRAFAWQQLLIARAIENQAYVVGVNRIGTDGQGIPYNGGSAVIDPMGETLWTKKDEAALAVISLDLTYLRELRTKLPFWRDRDEFKLITNDK